MQLDIFTEPNSTKPYSTESNFFIYKSSAGSGKTYTLVKEYLKIVLNNPEDYKHTLAITFTNKAAEEMKTRVVLRLVELSKGESHTLRELLAKEGVSGNIQEKSQDVLSKILHDYSHFSITTIDSFFHLVIRSFARELKLQLGYNVEIEEEIVLEQVVDELLDSVGSDDELRRYIEDYIFYSIEQDKGWKVDFKIKKIGKEVFSEKYWEKFEGKDEELRNTRKIINKLIPKLFGIVNDFETKLKSFGKESLKIISDFGLEISDFKRGTASYLARLKDSKSYPEDIEPTKTVMKILTGEEKWYTQKSFKKAEIENAAKNGLNDLLTKIISHYDSNLTEYTSAKELLKTIYILGIFKDILDKLKKHRDENKLLLISDTNKLLKSVISEETSPFIYERIGNHFKNFLIDEFQDTSNYQWINLLPLLINTLSEGNKVIIVGDVKQSIYRFRGGNMKLLLEKVQEDLKAFGCREEKLLDNRRSRKEIVKFNNEFFPKVTESMAVEIEDEYKKLFVNSYREIIQHETFCDDGGYVKINFIPKKKDSDEKTAVIADKKVIEILREVLSDNYELKDVMILTRTNAECSRIAHLLSANGIRVVSSESLLLSNSPKVKLIFNMLKYITDSRNAQAMTEVLYQYLVYIKNKTPECHELFTDHKARGEKFYSLLPPELFNKTLTHINASLTKLPLYDLTEALIRIFSIGENTDSYLLRFLDAVSEYSKKFGTDINSFISWWEEHAEDHTIVIPQNENAVKVLTIHKAKGLESPVVIIPYCSWSMGIMFNTMIWASSGVPPFNESPAFALNAGAPLRKSYFSEDYEEESVMTKIDNLNNLYVAFTRAEDRLYVLCPEQENFSKDGADKTICSAVSVMNGFDEGKNIFECGTKEKKESKAEKESTYRAEKIYSTNFSKKLIIKGQGASPELKKIQDKGSLLHRALSYIKKTDDIEQAAERLTAEGLLSYKDKDSFVKDLNAIVTHPDAEDWFTDKFKIINEAEMILPDGKILRPDRVMLKNDSAIIVDYKTGSENDSHKKQLNLYADALQKTGIKNVDKYLYYITQKKISKVE